MGRVGRGPVLALCAALVALAALARRLLTRSRAVAQARISSPEEHTTTGADGAVRSVQAADLTLSTADLDRLWTPMNLERLARTYWRFLTRVTLGLIRVHYSDEERYVCLLARPFVLLSFQAPEYEIETGHGLVRWRIAKGLLVARPGCGHLEIDVRRLPAEEPDMARLHVEVEVASFYPAIASSLGRWMYENTQSRVHVIVTHGFLRSLARLDLAESRVGRLA
jgi:hypothetical protein